jgi:hypothetical protein
MIYLMSKYFILGIILIPIFSFSQSKEDYIWELGASSRIGQDPYAKSIEVNFNNDSLSLDTFYRSLFMGYLNASISDKDGNLLLYTNGCEVRDGKHELIQGSKYLNSGDVNTEWCIQNSYGYSVFEGGIFLPSKNDSIIDLFHQRLIILSQPLRLYVDTLYLTQFDKFGSSYTLNKKAVPIIGGQLSQGNLEAISTIDGKGWWIIQNDQNSNNYHILLDYNGAIDTIHEQRIGDTTSAKGAAQSVFSPDGRMYARFCSRDQLFLFDFDRLSGELSNYRRIHVIDTNDYSGVAFSGNSRFLYTCTTTDLYQFDTWASDIESTMIHIGHYDGFIDPFPALFYLMQLGPDCRIYISTPNGNNSWHVIQEPDEQGLACLFEQHAFHFPVSNSITMPNFPVFRVNDNQPCNPDIITGFFQFYVPPLPLNISPNPTDNVIHINLPEVLKNEKYIEMEILDQLGHVWKEKMLDGNENSMMIECQDLPSGLYFIRLMSEGRWLGGEFVKM